MQLPSTFAGRMEKILGTEYDEFMRSYEQKRLYGLRVNNRKISTEQFLKIAPFHLTRIPWIENGFYYEEQDRPGKHPYYSAGLYYLQEPSAMTPANILPVNPGERVLDLCAAPGGKSTELGVKLKGQGLLVANDISASRAKALLKNIELFGIPNALITSEPPVNLMRYFGAYFDKILIDAPCSGEGMFRKDPSMIKSWEKNGPEFYAKIQREIILQAAAMLKPGGQMLYSTCTFSAEEDEGTIEYLLSEDPSFHVIPIAGRYEGFAPAKPELVGGREEIRGCVRIWPHRMNGEGHFVALLQKDESGASEASLGNSAARRISEFPELAEFLKPVRTDLNLERLEARQEKISALPAEMGDLKGLHYLRTGLYLGELKKKRFEPSQAFAMALEKEAFPAIISLPSEDIRVRKYLKGETIDVSGLPILASGSWQLVCVDGYPLGWGKLTNGNLKNKYHPGWRWQS